VRAQKSADGARGFAKSAPTLEEMGEKMLEFKAILQFLAG
jgi:hypothetical protein